MAGAVTRAVLRVKLPSLEMYERQYPWQYLQVEYATDTAAPGEFRGAPALHYRRRMLDPVNAIVYNQGGVTDAGLLGGGPGPGITFVLNQGARGRAHGHRLLL